MSADNSVDLLAITTVDRMVVLLVVTMAGKMVDPSVCNSVALKVVR